MAELPAVIIVGAGPAGLMAAQLLAEAGYRVQVYDKMPAPGRKFLRAGVGGLNLTHNEPAESFVRRYDPYASVASWLQLMDADGVRQWAAALGIETFVGSSGRVFPVQKKASPLLRAWLQHLGSLGVIIRTRYQWLGWQNHGAGNNQEQIHQFSTASGVEYVHAQASILAMGGGSWSRLGSDGQWLQVLNKVGVETQPLSASNCGFDYPWSAYLQQEFAGQPIKTITLKVVANGRELFRRRGEALISRDGIQGSVVYAASRSINQCLRDHGVATLVWDLMPDHAVTVIEERLRKPRGKESMANYLRKRLGLSPLKVVLLRELMGERAAEQMADPARLAAAIKALPMAVYKARPVEEAISTSGGVSLSALDRNLMLLAHPGVFCAGEMLDWDAPTGGYLLTACLASGKVAAQGVLEYLKTQRQI